MQLIFLLLGVGLGFVGSQVTRSFKKPVVSTTSLPQGTDSNHMQPPQEHQINSEILNQSSSNLSKQDRLNPVESTEIGSERAEFAPVENKETTAFAVSFSEQAGSSKQRSSHLPLSDEQLGISSIDQKMELSKEEQKPLPADIELIKEELKQAQLAYEMAKEMSQFKGGFLARTAHELRSPLSSLIGMHQLILSDLCDSPEEAKEFIAQANTSALKMVKLLDEVIAVSKVEHGSNRLDIVDVPLSQVFDEVFSLTYLQAANNNLQFEIVPPDPEIHVLADSRRFRQVLVGIVDTAIAQLSERKEGSIKVSGAGYPDSKEVRVWIDVQSPITAWSEVVDLLATTPQAHQQSSKPSELPPGLTLLMVQTLVEAMQGKLAVLPIPDEDKVVSSATEHCIRLQCSIPLATPEPVEQALA